MNFPFTTDEFLNVFRLYNESIFPAQIAFYILGGTALYLLIARKPWSGRAIGGILGLFWLWMGIVYHILFFAKINPAAYAFGGLFVLEGLLLLYVGVWKNGLAVGFEPDGRSVIGMALIAYAMIVYPLIGIAAGHAYPYSPVFGVAPCPSTIFTFGILMQQREGRNVPVLIVPVLWALIGFFAAVNLGIVEDIGLLIAAIAAVTGLFVSNRNNGTHAVTAG